MVHPKTILQPSVPDSRARGLLWVGRCWPGLPSVCFPLHRGHSAALPRKGAVRQSRPKGNVGAGSGLPQSADIEQRGLWVSFGPLAALASLLRLPRKRV
jgi:hypothetical protein